MQGCLYQMKVCEWMPAVCVNVVNKSFEASQISYEVYSRPRAMLILNEWVTASLTYAEFVQQARSRQIKA